MDSSIHDKHWPILKSKIRNRWGKFSDQELNTLKSDFTQLQGKIQKAYGLSKELAEFQYEEFKTSVFALLSGETAQASKAEKEPETAQDPAKSRQAV